MILITVEETKMLKVLITGNLLPLWHWRSCKADFSLQSHSLHLLQLVLECLLHLELTNFDLNLLESLVTSCWTWSTSVPARGGEGFRSLALPLPKAAISSEILCFLLLVLIQLWI